MAKPAIVKEIGILWMHIDCLCKVVNCFVVVSSPVPRDSPVVVSIRVLWFNPQRLGVVGYSLVELRDKKGVSCVVPRLPSLHATHLTQLIESKTSVEKRLEVFPIVLDGRAILNDGLFKVASFPQCESLRVVNIGS